MIKISPISYNYTCFQQELDGLVAPRRNSLYRNIFKYPTILILHWIALYYKNSLGYYNL
jgi:hypothetical protein